MSDKTTIEIDCENNIVMISAAEPQKLELVGKEYKAKKSITISMILIAEVRILMKMSEDELNLLVEKIERL